MFAPTQNKSDATLLPFTGRVHGRVEGHGIFKTLHVRANYPCHADGQNSRKTRENFGGRV